MIGVGASGWLFMPISSRTCFFVGPMTYAEAYASCFGRPIEIRRAVRPEPNSEPVIDP
jgi:hypothetical protein